MKLKSFLAFLAMACTFTLTACDDDDDNCDCDYDVELTVPTATEIAAPNATITCRIDQDDDTRAMGYGFCYDTQENPTIYKSAVKVLPEGGLLTTTLADLADNTRYYVRAFVTIYPSGIVYSPQVEVVVGTPVEETPEEPETPEESETPAE